MFAQHVVCTEDADERTQRVERQPEFACVAGVDVPHGPKGEHEQANHAEAVPFFAGDFAVHRGENQHDDGDKDERFEFLAIVLHGGNSRWLG